MNDGGRPVVIGSGELAEQILLTPLLELLHERYGRACALATTGVGGGLLLRTHPHVAHRFEIADLSRRYYFSPRQWQFVEYLRAQDAGPVYVCVRSGLEKIQELLRRGDVGADRSVCWTDFPEDDGLHWGDRWLALGMHTPAAYDVAKAENAGSRPRVVSRPDPRKYRPTLRVEREERQQLQRWLHDRTLADRPLVLLQPGDLPIGWGRPTHNPASGVQTWPIERWMRLCGVIRCDLPRASLLLIGTAAELPLLQSIQASDSGETHLAAGDLSLRQLLALQERALAMICVNNAAAYSAAALGCPVVVLYGAQPPAQWLPRSGADSPVLAVRARSATPTVADISTDLAVEAWRSLLHAVLPRLAGVSSPCNRSHD